MGKEGARACTRGLLDQPAIRRGRKPLIIFPLNVNYGIKDPRRHNLCLETLLGESPLCRPSYSNLIAAPLAL